VALISWAVAGSLSLPSTPMKKIIVTGAAGRTGKLVFTSLEKSSEYAPVGLVRTERSAKKLYNDVKCALEHVCICDVTQLDPTTDSGVPQGLAGAEAMIICTSAVPKISKRSLLRQFAKVPINLIMRKKAFDFRGLRFQYAPKQYPEMVDYVGQVAQIDLAKKLGIPHVVVVSSMGGTDPSNFLNQIGKDKDGNGNGDILVWKRKAEEYLVQSGLDYTIIHPGGLKDTLGGESDIVIGVDDKLMDKENRSISRSDVASLCVAALSAGEGKKVSLDCVNAPVMDGQTPKSASFYLKQFLKTKKTCKYDTVLVPELLSV